MRDQRGMAAERWLGPRPKPATEHARLQHFWRQLAAALPLRNQRELTGEKPAVACAWVDNKRCRFAGTFTGATGLEPATSGVTGRSWRLRAKARIGGDLRREQSLTTLALRGFAGMGGRFRRPPAGNVRDASLP